MSAILERIQYRQEEAEEGPRKAGRWLDGCILVALLTSTSHMLNNIVCRLVFFS